MFTAGSPLGLSDHPAPPSFPPSSSSPRTLPSSLPRCAFPPRGQAHATTAWHRVPSLAKNHRPAATRATKPCRVWQTLRDFPSDGTSAQLPRKHQKVQLILRAWGSLLQANFFLQKHLFNAYRSIELVWFLNCEAIQEAHLQQGWDEGGHTGACRSHTEQGCCGS